MSECTHDCSTCKSADCGSRKENLIKKPHKKSKIKRVIGIVSGKGGVGKSLVTALTAVSFNRRGYKTAIMDADITGPSVPKMFGITQKATADNDGLYPVKTKTDIDVMSINLLLEDETDPVVWRGPVIGGAVSQFWTDVIWKDVDYMFVDMPPGTGDVSLTVFQSIPVDGIIIVTSPQELVSMIVEKAVKMAKMMNVPVLGIVENMSYVLCPDCGKKIHIYGESKIEETASKFALPVLGRLPINPEYASLCDKGQVENFAGDYLEDGITMIETLLKVK